LVFEHDDAQSLVDENSLKSESINQLYFLSINLRMRMKTQKPKEKNGSNYENHLLRNCVPKNIPIQNPDGITAKTKHPFWGTLYLF